MAECIAVQSPARKHEPRILLLHAWSSDEAYGQLDAGQKRRALRQQKMPRPTQPMGTLATPWHRSDLGPTSRTRMRSLCRASSKEMSRASRRQRHNPVRPKIQRCTTHPSMECAQVSRIHSASATLRKRQPKSLAMGRVRRHSSPQ